jgi:hypothetical protein
MKMTLYHFTETKNSNVFFTAYETNTPNVYELTAIFSIVKKGVKYNFTHIFCNSDGLFYACLSETEKYDSDSCLGAYNVSPVPNSDIKLISSDGSTISYKIIGAPKVIRGQNSELWIEVTTEPSNTSSFPANSQNIQALGVQNQVYAISADIQQEFSEESSQDSPSSRATNSPFRHK